MNVYVKSNHKSALMPMPPQKPLFSFHADRILSDKKNGRSLSGCFMALDKKASDLQSM